MNPIVGVRFPLDLRREIQKAAKADGLSMSAWLRNLAALELRRRKVRERTEHGE